MSQPTSPVMASWTCTGEEQQDSWKALFHRWPASAQPLLTPLLSASSSLRPPKASSPPQVEDLTAKTLLEALEPDPNDGSPSITTGADAHSFVPFGTLWAQSKALGNLWASLQDDDGDDGHDAPSELSDKRLFRPEAARRAEQHPKAESKKRRLKAYCVSAVGPLKVVNPA